MSDGTPCPTCGTPIPAGSPGGACPRCLLAAGLESGGAAGPAAPPSPEEMGRHFPALEVLEVLGQGGMGIVYKARQRNLDRLVALKVLPPEAAREPGFAERFTREARTLARLHHPHIVGVHDFGETGGLYYLVMEYVDGPNLRRVIGEGRLEAKQALAIVPQVCDALQYAHDQGVVHRDIKPENILLDREGRVKIADFGLAKIVQRAPMDLTITRAGQVMGTLQYMAPEQYRAPDSVDHRADIYSLGVVFYEMLTGEVPVGVFPPPSKKAHVDARLDGVVLRALEKERERRWQHASEVRTQVDSIAAGAAAGAAAGVAAAAAATPPPPPPEPRLHWPAVAGGLAVPAAVLASIAFYLLARIFASPGGAHNVASGAYLLVGLTGWILAIVAWVQIQHSGGRLSGKPWAIVGTLATPFLLCCPGYVLVPGDSDAFDGIEFGKHGFLLPGISIEDGPGGTKISVPGVTIEDKGGTPDQGGGAPTPPPETRPAGPEGTGPAGVVVGGPPGMKDQDRIEVVKAVSLAWRDPEAILHAHFPGLDLEKRAAELRPFSIALSRDGKRGRVVMTDKSVTIALSGQLFEGRWIWDHHLVQHLGRTANEEDRDGWLGPAATEDEAREDPAQIAADACLVHGGPAPKTAADLAATAREVRLLWKRNGREYLLLARKVQTGKDEILEPELVPAITSTREFSLYAVWLNVDGRSGRAVFSSPEWTVSLPIVRSGPWFEFAGDHLQRRKGPAEKGDEDGQLFQ